MPFWKKLWALFSAIWVLVAALQVITLLAFGEEAPPGAAWRPVLLGIAVPAAGYAVGLLWEYFTRK